MATRFEHRLALQAVEIDDDGEEELVTVLDTIDTIDITPDPQRASQVWRLVHQAVNGPAFRG